MHMCLWVQQYYIITLFIAYNIIPNCSDQHIYVTHISVTNV